MAGNFQAELQRKKNPQLFCDFFEKIPYLHRLKVKISKQQTKNMILPLDKLNLESAGTCVLRVGL